jgi:tRNA/rRNA methyltransferase
VPKERAPVRGLARLLRRNATDAERLLWKTMVNDRRFAGRGFKRQVPIGQHIAEFVSFPLRIVLDLLPPQESETSAQARAEKRAWLSGRGYRIIEMKAAEIEEDVLEVLDRLDLELKSDTVRQPSSPES